MSNYTKLKTNLKLSIQRLKLLGKKKTEQSLKSRKEIADYISANKPDRARIRVEHIIREDNFVEALEILEMFCDLLLARFGLIEKMKELDPGLDEAISTVLWASPRISNDIQEFKIIAEILAHKYGKKYADACKADSLNNVNDKVKRKLGVEPPPKILVENYLIEIAKNFNIKYDPDPTVMLQSGQMDEDLLHLRERTNEITEKFGGDGSSGGGAGGFGGGASGGSGSGGGGGGMAGAMALDPTARPIGFQAELPPYSSADEKSAPPASEVFNGHDDQAPPMPPKTHNSYDNQSSQQPGAGNYNLPPTYQQSNFQSQNRQEKPAAVPGGHDLDDFLGLPAVPDDLPNFNNNQNQQNNDDHSRSIEFDDLARRFENLKSKK